MTANTVPEPVVPAPSLADLCPRDRAILQAIAAERAARGQGPTRRELRASLGLPPPSRTATGRRTDAYSCRLRRRIKRLREQGWLVSDASLPRSLDIGPTLREAFRASRSRETAQ